jgi:hypothetical protein
MRIAYFSKVGVRMREDKEAAINLRKKGKSYNEIQRALQIPKSTLSGWFSNLRFSEDVKIGLLRDTKKKWAQNITNYNRRRAKAVLEAAMKVQDRESQRIKEISKRELWLLGTALYWAEGSKRERWQVRFSNSDPGMIRLIMKFFRDVCNISEHKFKLSIHAHQNVSEKKAKRYWSGITNVPISQFNKSIYSVSKASKNKREPNRLPYGTLRIAVSDVNSMNRIKGWLKGLTRIE